jgi:hypothetical protein
LTDFSLSCRDDMAAHGGCGRGVPIQNEARFSACGGEREEEERENSKFWGVEWPAAARQRDDLSGRASPLQPLDDNAPPQPLDSFLWMRFHDMTLNTLDK